jgi:predicted GIY-YIG superfamily endonuclease
VWYLYILKCRDDSYYTGITKDVESRLDRHNSGKGAKYTRMKRPCSPVYIEEHPDESSARRREIEIKNWRRDKKNELIQSFVSSAINGLIKTSGRP